MAPKVILLVGNPKTGKTVSACTFPKPLAFIDIDGDGIDAIYNAKDSLGNLVVPAAESAPGSIDRIELQSQQVYTMQFQTVQKGKVSPAHAGEAPALLNKFDMALRNIKAGKNILNPAEPKQYKTVVIDPLTEFFRLWKDACMFMNQQPSMQKQDYGTLETVLFRQFLPNMKALPVDYVILINHTATEKDDLTGAIHEFPVGPSKNQGRLLPGAFTEVWLQKEEMGKYLWRTRKEGLMEGVGSRYHLPNPVEARFSNVKSYLEQAKLHTTEAEATATATATATPTPQQA